MPRPAILLALILCFCASVSTQEHQQGHAAEPNAKTTAEEAAWRFEFVDTNDDPLGYMVLAFTETQVGEPICDNDGWSQMLVLEDELNFDFGVESRPAYLISGPWLTIDLTSSVCYLDHNLIGNISPGGASGFFYFVAQDRWSEYRKIYRQAGFSNGAGCFNGT